MPDYERVSVVSPRLRSPPTQTPAFVSIGQRNPADANINERRISAATTNRSAISNRHKCQRPDLAASWRKSYWPYTVTPWPIFCAGVLIVSAAILYCKDNSAESGGFTRAELDSGAQTIWIPPAERPVPLPTFPCYSPFGFHPQSNTSSGNNPERNNPSRNNTNSNSTKRDNPQWNNLNRSLIPSLDELPRAEDTVNGNDEIVDECSHILLFMHVWKCAGSSLRGLLRQWAELEEETIAIVVTCNNVASEVSRHASFKGLGGEKPLHDRWRLIHTWFRCLSRQ